MLAGLAVDVVLLLHLVFIAFVLAGGLLAFRWRAIIAAHIPAIGWAVFVESTGAICPLTFVENALRASAGASGYSGSFVEHYLLALIYPAGLTPDIQIGLAALVILVNGAIYAALWRALRRQRIARRASNAAGRGGRSAGTAGPVSHQT